MYDSKCRDLAEAFLLDCRNVKGNDAHKLAQAIQDAIEDWIEENFTEEDRS